MVKSVTFVTILMGILIAQVVCPRPPETKKPPKPVTNQAEIDLEDHETDDNDYKDGDENGDEDDDASDDPEETEPSLPFLTCTIFQDNFACNAMCSVLRSIYGTPITSGVCEEAKECECQVLPKATLEDYWNEKFLAKNTLQEILQNEELSGKILKALKTPFKTAQQTIEDLKQHLSTKQLSNLQIKNKSAQKLFSNDGEFDKVAVQKYVASKLKSLKKPSDGVDYKKTLLDVLNSLDNKDIVDYVINEIRQSKNKPLNSIIEDYVKEHGIQVQEPSIDSKDPENIVDILDTAVINELIKPPPRENALKLTGLRSMPKKSAAGAVQKPKAQRVPSTGSATKSNQSSANTATKSNKPDTSASKPIFNDRWEFEGFDKTAISQVKNGIKCWEKRFSWEVCVYKDSSSVQFGWGNNRDEVSIKVYHNGDIKQEFEFRDLGLDTGYRNLVRINIEKFSESGTQTEKWKLLRNSLMLTKSADGKIRKDWNEIEELESLAKNRKNIEEWCAQNESLVGKGNCLITLT